MRSHSEKELDRVSDAAEGTAYLPKGTVQTMLSMLSGLKMAFLFPVKFLVFFQQKFKSNIFLFEFELFEIMLRVCII